MRRETYQHGCTLTIKISDGREIELEEFIERGREYVIGSRDDCHVVVSSARQVHATLRCVDNQWWIFYSNRTVGIKHGADQEDVYHYEPGMDGQTRSGCFPWEFQHAFLLASGNCAIIGDTLLEFSYDRFKRHYWAGNGLPSC